MPVTVYTVGHGGLRVEQLVSALKAQSVECVIDVRSQPYSRYAPAFNREHLESVLALHDLSYRWMGDFLGGRPPENLRTPAGLPDYDRMLEQPLTQQALNEVVRIARDRPVALMCSELRPEGCHRSRMLEPELERRGAFVEHILPTGEVLTRPTLFA